MSQWYEVWVVDCAKMSLFFWNGWRHTQGGNKGLIKFWLARRRGPKQVPRVARNGRKKSKGLFRVALKQLPTAVQQAKPQIPFRNDKESEGAVDLRERMLQQAPGKGDNHVTP